jgi:hypothetical protein
LGLGARFGCELSMGGLEAGWEVAGLALDFKGAELLEAVGCSAGWERTGLPGAPHAALACGGFESSSAPSFSHDAVRPNATSFQIHLRIFSISSRKQLWVGHVFFRPSTVGLQELVEANESAKAEEEAGRASRHDLLVIGKKSDNLIIGL